MAASAATVSGGITESTAKKLTDQNATHSLCCHRALDRRTGRANLARGMIGTCVQVTLVWLTLSAVFDCAYPGSRPDLRFAAVKDPVNNYRSPFDKLRANGQGLDCDGREPVEP
jgi:hypothetical protein